LEPVDHGLREISMKPRPHRAVLHAHLIGPALAGAMVAAAAIGSGGLPAAHAAGDESLGAALYESRCTGCHERSVHTRSPRRAASFDQIRAYVWRWDRYLGGAWQHDEIDAVAKYLNERYYHFPCPQDVCGLAAR
jgi:mono/diheme cytochrome c family protein